MEQETTTTSNDAPDVRLATKSDDPFEDATRIPDILFQFDEKMTFTTPPSPPSPPTFDLEGSISEIPVENVVDDKMIDPMPTDIQNSLSELLQPTVLDKTFIQVCHLRPDIEDLYKERAQYSDDAGWDLHFPEDITVDAGQTARIPFGVAVACFEDEEYMTPTPFWLIPRSSIVNTPLRMANGIGLIDSGYRGELVAVVDNRSDQPFEIKRGTRLFQLVGPAMRPFQWKFVASLPNTERGTGGFGSTGT